MINIHPSHYIKAFNSTRLEDMVRRVKLYHQVLAQNWLPKETPLSNYINLQRSQISVE